MSCYTTKTDTENFYNFSMLVFNFRLPSVILCLFKILLKYCCKYIDVRVIQVEFECSALENLFFIGFYSQIYLWTPNTLMLLLFYFSFYNKRKFEKLWVGFMKYWPTFSAVIILIPVLVWFVLSSFHFFSFVGNSILWYKKKFRLELRNYIVHATRIKTQLCKNPTLKISCHPCLILIMCQSSHSISVSFNFVTIITIKKVG